MPIAGSVGGPTQKAIPAKAGTDHGCAPMDIGRPPAVSISATWAQHAIVFCASAILFALAAYIIAFYGFNAVVKCELRSSLFLRQTQTVITEIALTSGCGL